MPLFEARDLKKVYNGRTVVDGVSLRVEPAEIVGLLGRNGAGKTTSFRMTIGMIERDGGQVFFKDQEVTGMPMYQHARMGMGYLSQEPSVFQRLTCEQNLLAILETLDIPRAEQKRRAADLLARFGLTHKAKEQARTCSGGERRKLEIARSLITEPQLILLDEPFSGVDPIAVEELQTEIRELTTLGISCLITDHNVQQTLRVCDRAYIIDSGRVLAEGTPKQLINDELVRRVYLGSLFRGDEFDAPFESKQDKRGDDNRGPGPRPPGNTPQGPRPVEPKPSAGPPRPAKPRVRPPSPAPSRPSAK
ncbi:MAG: LPS export ABC transporter ATP-binding protein [Phycisphaerales bacterium]